MNTITPQDGVILGYLRTRKPIKQTARKLLISLLSPNARKLLKEKKGETK